VFVFWKKKKEGKHQDHPPEVLVKNLAYAALDRGCKLLVLCVPGHAKAVWVTGMLGYSHGANAEH
jgi:hypothetical protein